MRQHVPASCFVLSFLNLGSYDFCEGRPPCSTTERRSFWMRTCFWVFMWQTLEAGTHLKAAAREDARAVTKIVVWLLCAFSGDLKNAQTIKLPDSFAPSSNSAGSHQGHRSKKHKVKWKDRMDTGRTKKRQGEARRMERADNSLEHIMYCICHTSVH